MYRLALRILPLVLFTCLGLLFLSGCVSDENREERLEQEIQVLKKRNEALEQKVKTLERERNTAMEPSFAAIQQWKEKFYEKYPLLKMKEWDKIEISQPGNNNIVTIEDTKVIRAFALALGQFEEAPPLGSGPHSDVPRYRYTLYSGDRTLIVDVVDRGMIRLNDDHDEYYLTGEYVHLLGNAFASPPEYINPLEMPVLTKLAFSGYMQGHEHYNFGVFSTFRIEGSVAPLAKSGKRLADAPVDPGEPYEVLDFYYFGEKLTLHLFQDKYIKIVTDQKTYWFEMNDPTKVGKILLAG